MRIGLITQAYYPVLGGVTEHVWNVGTQLVRRGHEVTVVTGATRHAQDRGLRVLRLGVQVPVVSNGANVHLTLGWDLARALREIESRERFDVVHIQSPLDPVLPLAASRAMRTPKVGTHHSARDVHSGADVVVRAFRRYLAEAAARIQRHVAVSESAAAFVHRVLPEVAMDVVPNGVDTRRFSPAVPPLEAFDDGVFTILFVGRLDPRKGARYLFAALPALEASLERYRVVVVGSSWLRGYYDAHIPERLRHRVRFAGVASPEALPRWYRSADVFCSPAVGNESFGIVLLEAMASGTPVVASDIAGYRSVIQPGVDGLLVPPREPERLAEALAGLARDPEARRRLGAAGRRKAETLDWSSVVDRLVPVYESVAGRAVEV